MPRRIEGEHVVLVLVAAAAAILALLPLFRLAVTAFWPAGAFDLEPFLSEVGTRSAMRALGRSVETSLVGGAGALVIGTVVALVVALTDVRAVRPVAFLFVLSALVAPQVTALAFLTLTGPASPILNAIGLAPPPGSSNPLMGAAGIISLLSLHHAPLVFVTVRAGLRNIPRDVVEAARAAGDPPLRVLRLIVLPLLTPYLVAAAALAVVAGVGNFGIPALLGMPVHYYTLPTLIYLELSSSGPSVLVEVAALSMLVTMFTLVGLVLSFATRRTRDTRLAALAPGERVFRLGPWRLPAELGLWALVTVVMVLPVASLLAAALVPAYGVALNASTLTFDNFIEVVVRQQVTARALRNSALYAATAAFVLAVTSIPFAHALDRRGGRLGRLVEAAFELPFALPGVVLAIAMILLFLKPLPVLGVSLYATPAIIIVAYLSRFAAMAIKAPVAAIRQMPKDLEEAARSCGAGYVRRLFTVVTPIAAPAAAAGGLLVFLTAFNELTVSALLWSAGTETFGVVLFNLEEGGYATLAAAVAIVAIAVITTVMLTLDAFGRRLPRGVVPWR
jgi:iron(III) transport system permease protein